MHPNDLDQFRSIANQLFEDEKKNPVVEPIPSSKLFEELDLELKDEGIPDEQLFNSLRNLVLKTPRTATDKFFNQLFAGRKSKAVIGDLLSIILNNSMYTYKVAGPMVGIEKEIINKTAELIGYDGKFGGTIVTGGSLANFMGMVMARDKKVATTKAEGVSSKMTLYTSENCHYSIAKNASLIGVGRNQVRFVKTDEHGKMMASDLETKIKEDLDQGLVPFFVNITAGTTVLGAFDPIEEIHKVSHKYDLWLHIDGAYCGAVVYSDKYSYLTKGVELSDSFNVNAHKMLGTPLTCSVFLAKDKNHLYHSFSSEAGYLYQTDDDDYNLGKTSLQCGRKNDALKLWTLWKSIGTKGLGKLVDHQFYLADVARDYLRSNPDYTLYSGDDSVSICFNYKNIDPVKLCTLLYEKASLMVGYGSREETTFVRFVTINSDNSKEEILAFFKDLEDFVAKNQEELQTENIISES